MTVDLDALIAEARKHAKLRVTYCEDLMGRLAAALESTLAELRQERERADENADATQGQNDLNRELGGALSRAEETIEKVLAVPNEFEWDVPPTAKRILTEYGKQKGADRG